MEDVQFRNNIIGWNDAIIIPAIHTLQELLKETEFDKKLTLWQHKQLKEIVVPYAGFQDSHIYLTWDFVPIKNPKNPERINVQVYLMALLKGVSFMAPVENPKPIKFNSWFPVMHTEVIYNINSEPKKWITTTLDAIFKIPQVLKALITVYQTAENPVHHQNLIWLIKEENRVIKIFRHTIENTYTINTESHNPKFTHMTIENIQSEKSMVKTLGRLMIMPYADNILEYTRKVKMDAPAETSMSIVLVKSDTAQLLLEATGKTFCYVLESNVNDASNSKLQYQLLKFNIDTESTLEVYSNLMYNLMILMDLALF